MTREPAKFIHDTKFIVSCNESACQLFHCNREQLIGLSVSALIVNEDFQGLAKLRMSQWRDGKTPIQPFKYKCWRCDGSIFWVSTVTQPIDGRLFETTVHEIDV